jgi:hypothetical protein
VETLPQFLKTLKTELPNDPAIPLLGTYPKELKATSCRDIFTLIFIKHYSQQQPKSPPTDEWINEM